MQDSGVNRHMTIPVWIENIFLRAADQAFSWRSWPHPGSERLSRCKIIAHRGAYDNARTFENTLAAFEVARNAGVWGVELDIQWTRDAIPVVSHDEDLYRLFKCRSRIDSIPFSQLRCEFPCIPTLEEVVQRFGRRLHLMIELKGIDVRNWDAQKRNLESSLGALEPIQEYHFLSMKPDILDEVDFVGPGALLPIAQANIRMISRLAMSKSYGGINAHYAFVTRKMIRRHRAMGQMLGTGYIPNRATLYRELNRGIEWIFSNHAVEVQRICGGQPPDRNAGGARTPVFG